MPVVRLNKTKIAREVALALGLPPEANDDKSFKIVTAVLNVMVENLRAGKPIHILGLGRFSVRTRKATKRRIFFGRQRHWHPIPTSTYVHFRPDRDLARTPYEPHKP